TDESEYKSNTIATAKDSSATTIAHNRSRIASAPASSQSAPASRAPAAQHRGTRPDAHKTAPTAP
ncbi:MAG TPA: hypothetical protein VIX37_24995, partial [Candidatus Sulfotelmatobacter sp.]